MSAKIDDFMLALEKSLSAKTFVKMTLGNYKGTAESLQKILVRLIDTRKGPRIQLQYRYNNRETVKNFVPGEAAAQVRDLIMSGFRSGHLFTTQNDLQLDIGKKSNRLVLAKPTFNTSPSAHHDRDKQYSISPHEPYLKALGIATEEGKIRTSQQDKWRQVNKFVEILSGLVDKSTLAGGQSLKIVDMGSGKGYLTFATYDYFTNIRGLNVSLTGVDTKPEIVRLCIDLATSCEFDGLKFVCSTIEEFEPGEIDILIALHACDTATDDAIFKGLSAHASLIVSAPCCHKEIRSQMKSPPMLKDVLKHGTLMERAAEMVTDGLRSLILERHGYATKVFEFVPVEHTAKNNMIAASKRPERQDTTRLGDQIDFLKSSFGIRHQRLESLLSRHAISTGPERN